MTGKKQDKRREPEDQAQPSAAMLGKKTKFSDARRWNLTRLVKGSRFHNREQRTSGEPRG